MFSRATSVLSVACWNLCTRRTFQLHRKIALGFIRRFHNFQLCFIRHSIRVVSISFFFCSSIAHNNSRTHIHIARCMLMFLLL